MATGPKRVNGPRHYDIEVVPAGILEHGIMQRLSSRELLRLGQSLIDLLGTIQHLEAVGVDLYLDQQSIDTTTPASKLLFQLTGAFAEFECSMIHQRVRTGLNALMRQGSS